MKSINILKAHFSGYKPTSKVQNRVLVENIDFLSWGVLIELSHKIVEHQSSQSLSPFQKENCVLFYFQMIQQLSLYKCNKPQTANNVGDAYDQILSPYPSLSIE